MGVMFFLGFVILVVLAICALGAVLGVPAGIVGLIFSNKARKNGKSFAKPLTIISAIVLGVGSVVIIFGSVCAVSAYVVNENIEDFTETDIVIEEEGYQDKRFTADGVVYERVEIDELWLIEPSYEPVFSYIERDELGNSTGTYDKIENKNGFNMVSGEDYCSIFCPVDEKEEVEAYYNDDSNYGWLIYQFNDKSSIKNNEAEKILNKILEIYKSDPETVMVDIYSDEYDEYIFEQVSKDGLFSKTSIIIYEYNDKYYFEKPYEEDEDYSFELKLVEIERGLGEKLINLID